MAHPLPPKKEVALALLEKSSVDVHLDPRKDGAIVPVSFKKQPQLVLKIGLNMPVPIPDLLLNEEGMFCTLSFNRQPFYCIVPWPSVFAMVGEDGRGMVWPDDVPSEIAVRAPEQPAARARPAAAKRALEPVRSVPASGSDEKPKAKRASRSKKPRIVAVENTPERPVLVALPPPPEPRGPRAVPNEKKRPLPPRPRPGMNANKVKRELPPYLRVVK